MFLRLLGELLFKKPEMVIGTFVGYPAKLCLFECERSPLRFETHATEIGVCYSFRPFLKRKTRDRFDCPDW